MPLQRPTFKLHYFSLYGTGRKSIFAADSTKHLHGHGMAAGKYDFRHLLWLCIF